MSEAANPEVVRLIPQHETRIIRDREGDHRLISQVL